MPQAPTLDQVRTFLAAADSGSFSAAGRKLGRAQSVISQTIANLEAQFGVALFDRTGRAPVLTEQGRALLPRARAVAASPEALRAAAGFLAQGLEAELSVAIDVMFPIERLTCAVVAFQAEFPNTRLRLYVEALGGVVQPVLDERCAFAVVGSLPVIPRELIAERLCGISLVPVAAPGHALARVASPIPTAILEQHVQLVLTDPSSLTEGRDFGVISARTWRLADLGAKHAFLRAGLGWGNMPLESVEADLEAGRLVRLVPEDGPREFGIGMLSVHTSRAPPGPAGRWLIGRLRNG